MRRVAFAVLGTIAGLVGLLTFKTHPGAVAGTSTALGTTNTGGASSGSTPSADPSAVPSAVPSASASSNSSGATAKTVTGDSVDTRWGPVQVKITVTNGTITKATAVDYPQNNGRDQEINAYAVPALEKESIGQTTSKIDMVSGATYTSDGYIESLQSALDKL